MSVSILRDFLVRLCSIVTILIYLLIAALLVGATIVGAMEAIALLEVAILTPSQETLTAALQSILLIIVIATLIDMVRSYVTYGRVLVRPILIAGITTMVRRLLVSTTTFLDVIGVTIVILGLTVAMVYLGREDRTITRLLNASHNTTNGHNNTEHIDTEALENEAVNVAESDNYEKACDAIEATKEKKEFRLFRGRT